MERNIMRYVKKYLDINSETIIENQNMILDLFLYEKQIMIQEELKSKNDLVFESYANIFKMDRDITKPIYEILNCKSKLNIKYPDGKRFAICLTHDVDDIYPTNAHMLRSSFHCMKNLNFNELKKQVLWKFKGKKYSPYCNFEGIMKLEEKYGAKSSFYFIATEKDPNRFRYNIEELENELGSIVDKSWEVGLHGGYYAYNNLKEMEKEKRRLEKVLGKVVIGHRNHYLRFKVPDTWELLAKAGFKYDTTFGYNDMVGFRNGMCHPFKPFNLDSDKEIDILEIPLSIMDGTLFKYMKLDYDKAWATTKRLIDTVEKYNGVLTILWHNNVFNCPFREKWKKLYEKTLKYCYDKSAWMTSGEEVYRWWEKK